MGARYVSVQLTSVHQEVHVSNDTSIQRSLTPLEPINSGRRSIAGDFAAPPLPEAVAEDGRSAIGQ